MQCMMEWKIQLYIFGILAALASSQECPEGIVCPVSIPARTDIAADDCDGPEADTIRSAIREGVAAAIEKDITPQLDELLRTRYLGVTSRYPASSCAEVKENAPDSLSGDYWLTNSLGQSVLAYCDLTAERVSLCGGSEGWVRVISLNMSNPDETCPGTSFTLLEPPALPLRVCDRSVENFACSGELLDIKSLNYSRVCGRVIGYQTGTGDGFQAFGHSRTIDEPYLDGVSLTYNDMGRQHIWSFASYTSEIWPVCPCSNGSTEGTPDFVGENYYCESGEPDGIVNLEMFYPDDPLWDGLSCGSVETPCCTHMNPPWFQRDLGKIVTSDIEIRICGDQEHADEHTTFQIVDIYVQ